MGGWEDVAFSSICCLKKLEPGGASTHLNLLSKSHRISQIASDVCLGDTVAFRKQVEMKNKGCCPS